MRQHALQEAKIVRLKRMKWFAAAASVLLGALAWWMIPKWNQPEKPEIIAADTPQTFRQQEPTYELPHTQLLGDSKPVEKKLPDAFRQAYQANDFAKAVEIALQQPDFQQDVQLKFYTAFAQFKLGQYDAALKQFDAVEKQNPGYEQAHIVWWRGLMYTLKGDTAQAQATLNKIPTYQFEYEKAQKLLELLNKK